MLGFCKPAISRFGFINIKYLSDRSGNEVQARNRETASLFYSSCSKKPRSNCGAMIYLLIMTLSSFRATRTKFFQGVPRKLRLLRYMFAYCYLTPRLDHRTGHYISSYRSTDRSEPYSAHQWKRIRAIEGAGRRVGALEGNALQIALALVHA